MDIAEGECSVDGNPAATLSSENLPHLACWSGLACKNLNFISNNDAWGRFVRSVLIIVAWVACIEVLIKNWEQKTFLAWPVHLYANCLQLLVSAGPTKCLGHLPQDGSHSWSSYRRQAEPHHAHGWWHSSGPGKGWSTKARLRLYMFWKSIQQSLQNCSFKLSHQGGASSAYSDPQAPLPVHRPRREICVKISHTTALNSFSSIWSIGPFPMSSSTLPIRTVVLTALLTFGFTSLLTRSRRHDNKSYHLKWSFYWDLQKIASVVVWSVMVSLKMYTMSKTKTTESQSLRIAKTKRTGRNGNSAMKGQKHIGSAKEVYYYKQNILSQCHGLIEIPTEQITERKIFRTGTENTTTMT